MSSMASTESPSLRGSPITTLPPEMLSLIFETFSDICIASKSPALPAVRLSHISQYWRKVALNLPSIWNTISLSPTASMERLVVYLQRSKVLPLDLQCDFCYLGESSTPAAESEHVMKLWKTIVQHTARWRRLSIEFHPTEAPSITLEMTSLYTPLLTNFQLTTTHDDNNSVIFQDGVPALKSLRFHGIPLQRYGPSLNALTRLDLASSTSMTYNEFLDVIVKMPRLAELSICGKVVGDWPTIGSTSTMITMPHLTFLRLSDRRWPLFAPLLTISAPILHTIVLYDLVNHDFPDPALEDQIRDNFPAVQYFALTGTATYLEDASFSQLARMFPNLVHAALSDVDEYLTRELLYALHDASFWPKLKILTVSSVRSVDILCSLIAVRISANHRLQSLILPVPDQLKQIDWMRERLLVEECRDALFAQQGVIDEPYPICLRGLAIST